MQDGVGYKRGLKWILTSLRSLRRNPASGVLLVIAGLFQGVNDNAQKAFTCLDASQGMIKGSIELKEFGARSEMD